MQHAYQLAPGRQPRGFAFEQAPAHDAVAAQQRAGEMLHRLRGRHARPAAGERVGLRIGGRLRVTPDRCPAPGVLQAEQRAAPPAPARALRCGHQQRAQARVAVAVDTAARDQLGQRVLQFGAQQPGVVEQVVEERGAVRGQHVQHALRARGQRRGVGAGLRHAAPQRGVAARQQHDGRVAHRCRGARILGLGRARAQPRPQRAPGGALVVQPGDGIVGHARGQDLAFPGRGRRLEAFQLRQHAGQRIGPAHARGLRELLPVAQEAHEVARLHRLYLAPQPLQRVAVDAREQVAFAPFDRGIRVAGGDGETTLHGHAFALQLQQRDVDVRGRHRQRIRELRDGDRAEAAQARAHQFGERGFAVRWRVGEFGRRLDRRGERGIREQRLQLRQAFGAGPYALARCGSGASCGSFGDWKQMLATDAAPTVARGGRRQAGGALVAGQALQPRGPRRVRRCLLGGDEAEGLQRLVHLVGIARIGPGLVADGFDGRGIEAAEVAGVLRVGVAAALHRLGAAFFQRRVVEEGVRLGVDRLHRQRRRRGEVAGDDLDFARFHAAQHLQPAGGVHRLVQAVVQRLRHQRVVGHLALADDVLQAGHLIGEHAGQQVLGLHPLQLRRHLLAALEARQRERGGRVPAPAHAEQGGVQQRLDQDVERGIRVQVACDFDERERMARRQRQHDRVLGRRGLQFEVELAAEALAQGQAPGAVDAAAERRVDHQLGAARLVEEALQHDAAMGGQLAQRRLRGGEVGGELAGGFVGKADVVAKPGDGVLEGRSKSPLPPCFKGGRRGGFDGGRRRRIDDGFDDSHRLRSVATCSGRSRRSEASAFVACRGLVTYRSFVTCRTFVACHGSRVAAVLPPLKKGGRGGCAFAMVRQPPRHLLAQPRDAEGKLVAAPGRFAQPERDRRRRALRVLDPHAAGLDAQHAVAGVAQLEDVAGAAFDGEVLVHAADGQRVGFEQHRVVAGVGDRAAGHHRGHAPALAAAQLAVDRVAMDQAGARAAAGGVALGDHPHHVVEILPRQAVVRPGAAQPVVEPVFVPFAAGHLGDDLLGQHVQRRRQDAQGVEFAAAHAVQQRRAFDQFVARGREQARLRHAADLVPCPSGALQEGGDRARRAELADQVDVADVDAQLQRRGRHQQLQLAALEPLFGVQPEFLGQAAVVRGDVFLAEQFAQVAGAAFGHAPGVDEHQRGAVLAGESGDAPVRLFPLVVAHHHRQRRVGQDQGEVALPGVTDVDDLAVGFRAES